MAPVTLDPPDARATPPRLPPAERILQAYTEGNCALLVTGRSLYDPVADGEGRLLTLLEHLRRHARSAHGMHLLTYSLANGLDWDAPRLRDGRDRHTIETVLRSHRLLEVQADEHEMVRVIRGIAALARAPAEGLAWSDGMPLRFVFVLEFAEHLTPSGEGTGRTDPEITAVELAHILGQSNALRQSGNLVVFHGREGRIDDLVAGVLHPVRLGQPDATEKYAFLVAARAVYPEARFEEGVTDEDVARLTSNTPNRGLEGRMRASHLRAAPVTVEELQEQKSRDVVILSEHTLTVLDTRRIDQLRLVGCNIKCPLDLLLRFGNGLLHGNPHIPANVLLVGPPGTGKTDLALLAAREARASAYQVHSPKGGIVGETERKARLLTLALSDWTPNVAFVDEITEALPLERSDFDGDSGASRAVTAALLTALSDESRRGRSLLVATTNCPWRMGAAMRSRFTIVPVLQPLREDYPAIISVIATRMMPEARLGPDEVRGAADLFYDKGASPREIRAALSMALLAASGLDPKIVLQAARDLRPSADRVSSEYADLWAIRACTSKRYLPWYADPGAYPYPAHLRELVDPVSGDVDVERLDARIRALGPGAHV
ncbi:MAG TPA: AAA family ATPase [Longimicrobium sp.]